MAKARTSKKSTTKTSQKTTLKKASPKQRTVSRGGEGSEAMGSEGLFGLPLRSWVGAARTARAAETRSAKTANVYCFATRDPKIVKAELRGALLPWQLDHAMKSEAEVMSFAGRTGPVFILRPPATVDALFRESHGGALEKCAAARARDQLGSVFAQIGAWKVESLALSFIGTSLEEERAGLLGLEMAAYSYSGVMRPRSRSAKRPRLLLKRSQLSTADMRWAGDLGTSVNIARHLINLPGAVLNPTTYAEAVRTLFKDVKNVEVDIWSGDKLIDERMGLMLGVGGGAAHGPCLVHLRYRPSGSGERRPLALVGKGVTFDSGGLDIKPSSAMRWMKKDMGGSAAVVGAMYWSAMRGLDQPLDAYLALAENSVDANSFRPGDVLTSRNGLAIEIHNTDAEGRLVLGDALDVALTSSEPPVAILDLATLTGAIKVALGADIAGLFSNHDALSELIDLAGRESGELTWRMPLYQPYKASLKSTFGDFANASDGFAGAITAALFLQQFVGKTPWAHLDIYSWKDAAGGAYAENGGSGQGVQLLACLLERWAEQGI